MATPIVAFPSSVDCDSDTRLFHHVLSDLFPGCEVYDLTTAKLRRVIITAQRLKMDRAS